MRACGIFTPMSGTSDDPRFTAHKMPSAMATETLLDIITSADLLQKACAETSSCRRSSRH
jgi:hypothetical protein